MKRKTILKILLAVGITGLVFLFYFHINDVRCVFINTSNQFIVSQDNNLTIYASIDTPKDTIQLLHEAIKEGVNKNELFWNKKLGKAVVIYCHNQNLYNKYGLKGFPAVTRLGTYIIVPSTGLEGEVFGHEFCHAEIFNNVGRNWWAYYQRLPTWFDEGLALQFNNNGIYSANALASIKKMSVEGLRKIDRPKNFYVKDYKQLRNHYCASKIELKKWLDVHDQEALSKVFRALKDGKDFYKAYSNPK